MLCRLDNGSLVRNIALWISINDDSKTVRSHTAYRVLSDKLKTVNLNCETTFPYKLAPKIPKKTPQEPWTWYNDDDECELEKYNNSTLCVVEYTPAAYRLSLTFHKPTPAFYIPVKDQTTRMFVIKHFYGFSDIEVFFCENNHMLKYGNECDEMFTIECGLTRTGIIIWFSNISRSFECATIRTKVND